MINLNLNKKKVQDFINDHLSGNIDYLIFKKSPFEEIKMAELVEQIEAKIKIREKLPTWYNNGKIIYPNKLNLEQSSSEKTAKYKSSIVKGKKIIDITGGFGVDSFFFSKKINKVIHCEINKKLSNISSHNASVLKVKNIENITIDGLKFLEQNEEIFDWIYIDPSRRNEKKQKKILIKDYNPNISDHIETLTKKSKNILVKLSPMLDIKSALRNLKNTKEIHVVGLKGEVKELLFIIEKKYVGEIIIKSINLSTKQPIYNHKFSDEFKSIVSYGKPLKYLYEPNSSVLKAGAFNLIGLDFDLHKLDPNTHLYTSIEFKNNFPGKVYHIEEIIKYKKTKIKKLISGLKINLKRRNFPKTIVEFKKEHKIKDGGNKFMFLTTCDKKPIILICSYVDLKT